MVRYVAFGLGLIIVGLGFVVYKLHYIGWGNITPTFFKEDETRVFDCYQEDEPTEITITFRNSGQIAIVESFGDVALVEFYKGGLAGDRYRGGEVTLVVSGEAYVNGMRGGSRGPCQISY